MQPLRPEAVAEPRVSAERMAELHVHVTSPEGALQAALHHLVERVPGALGASVADANGLPIASTFPDQNQLRLAGALAAMIGRAARGALEWLGPNRFQTAALEGSVHTIVVCDVSEGTGSLILVIDRDGDLAAAKREILRAAMEVTTVLDLDVG